jgi:uncharacterized membrane protein
MNREHDIKTGVFSTKDMAVIGMLAALCTVATYIKVPAGNGAMVHLGSAAIFTAALLFGGTKAGLAGAIGSGVFDIIGGFSPYTLWSFVIKGVAGFLVGLIASSEISRKVRTKLSQHKSNRAKAVLEMSKNLLAVLTGTVWNLAGYLIAWTVVLESFEAAMGNAVFSILTSAVGILVSIPLAATLKKPLSKYSRTI